MLKNKKFLGKIQEQTIRTKSKPLIAEVNSEANSIHNQSPAQSVTNSNEPKEINKYLND